MATDDSTPFKGIAQIPAKIYAEDFPKPSRISLHGGRFLEKIMLQLPGSENSQDREGTRD
jgi:hypothetical protein